MVDLSPLIREDMERYAMELLRGNPDATAEDLTNHGFTADQVAAYGAQAIRQARGELGRQPPERIRPYVADLVAGDLLDRATNALTEGTILAAGCFGVQAALAGSLNGFLNAAFRLGVPKVVIAREFQYCLENLDAAHRLHTLVNTPAGNSKARPS